MLKINEKLLDKKYLKGKLLWTNKNITNSFSSQTINLSSDDYDFYEIYCGYNNDNLQYVNCWKTVKGKGMIISENGYQSGLLTRRKIDYITDTSLAISDCYAVENILNGYLLPLYIIGYKYDVIDKKILNNIEH